MQDAKNNRQLLGLLGLCRRAGRLKTGFDAAVEAAKSGEARLIVTARDLSAKSRKELAFKTQNSGAEIISAPVDIEDIARILNRRAGILAVADEGFARAVKSAAARACEEDTVL